MLVSAGDQLPMMLLIDVVGNGERESPLQICDTALKVGVVGWFTTTVNVVVVAHSAAFGVNV